VIDVAGNISEIRYRIHVLGPKSEEEKKKIRIKKEIDTETKSEKS
jgi:hypothetical protein